jgi:hypothetical protein
MDDEWRAENLTKTTEPTTSPQVVLLFQGVTSIASAEGKPEEFIVTVVKEGGGEVIPSAESTLNHISYADIVHHLCVIRFSPTVVTSQFPSSTISVNSLPS